MEPVDPAQPAKMETVTLVKGDQHHCIRYQVGEEGAALDEVVSMVERKDLKFDWFDAAMMSHQIGQHLAKQLKGYFGPNGQSA